MSSIISDICQVNKDSSFNSLCGILPPISKNKPLEGIEITLSNLEDLFSSTISIYNKVVEEGWNSYENNPNAEETLIAKTDKAYFILRRESRNKRNYNNILERVTYCFPISWYNFISKHYEYFLNQDNMLKSEDQTKFTPYIYNIFNVFESINCDDISVVILGQDPYIEYGYATGLAYSLPPNIGRESTAIKAIFNELKRDLGNKWQTPSNGDLSPWTKRKVMLLNKYLTTKQGQSNAHKDYWAGFCEAVIRFICKRNDKIVFMLWGREASSPSIKSAIGGKHLILESSHPSEGFYNKRQDSFVGCGHFSKANAFLIKNKKEPIDWRL